MKLSCNGRGKMKIVSGIFGMALVLFGVSVSAQTAAIETQKEPVAARSSSDSVQTFYLTNVSQPNDGNEIVVAVRNLLPPQAKVFFVPNQNALVVSTTPDQLVLAQRLLKDLDRPKKTYRLTYTITETEIGRAHV